MIKVSETGEKHLVYQLGETEKDIRIQLCNLVLENNNYNIAATARALGLKRTSMAMRVKKWGLMKREEYEQQEQVEDVQQV